MPEYSDLSYALSGYGKRANPFEARRRAGYQLLQQGSDTSPILSPWQGVGRLAQALAGGIDLGMADRDEKVADTKRAAGLAAAMAEKDPQKRLGLLSAIEPEIGVRAAASSAGDELKLKRQRDDDMQAANFLLPGGQAQPGQATGAPPPLQPRPGPQEWEPHFQVASQATGLPVDLLKRVAMKESAGDANAVSPAGATGPMQLMPGTARDLGVIDSRDPAQAIPKGAQYLKQQLDKYGNLPHALAAYNWGPGNVDNWLKGGGDPAKLPAETRDYIATIAGGQQGGNGVQPAQFSPQGGADPGGQYEAAARRAQAAGRGDIAVKYMLEATKAREAAGARDANRTLQHVDLGDAIGVMDPRSGQIIQRIPKGQAPGTAKPGGDGAFAGTGMDAQARNALVRAAKDPAFAQTPEYAAAHGFLSQPRQSFDESRGVMVTLPPADLSAFPPPAFRVGQQPQQAPQASNGAPPPVGPQDFAQGAPPAPNPAGVSGPTVIGQPPQAPPQGPVVTPVPGLPPKPMTAEQALASGFTDKMLNANDVLSRLEGAGLSAKGQLNEKIPMLGNYAQTPEYQQYKQARDSFINAQLRRESGAAISDAEYERADKQYFPQPGDDPQTIANKARERQITVEAMRRNAGQSYQPNPSISNGPPQGSNDGPRPGQMPTIRNDADYNALPPGTQYIAPDGSTRTKRGG